MSPWTPGTAEWKSASMIPGEASTMLGRPRTDHTRYDLMSLGIDTALIDELLCLASLACDPSMEVSSVPSTSARPTTAKDATARAPPPMRSFPRQVEVVEVLDDDESDINLRTGVEGEA